MNDSKPVRHILQEGNEFQVDLLIALRSVLEEPIKLMEDIHNLEAYTNNIENHHKLLENHKRRLSRSIENVYKKYGYNIETGRTVFEVIHISGYIDAWQIVVGIDRIENFDQSKNPKSVYKKYIWVTVCFYALQSSSKKTRDIKYLIHKRESK